MGLNRGVLKRDAKLALKDNWGTMVVIVLLQYLIVAALNFIPMINMVSFLILPGLSLGITMCSLKVARKEQVGVPNMFDGFKYFLKAFGLQFMIGLYVFLWSLLLIIPGIIATYRYSLAVMVLADNPELSISECINRSKELTSGNKWFIFVLGLSFIGWSILTVFTFGIGILWLLPYINVTTAVLYLYVTGDSSIDNNNGPELA